MKAVLLASTMLMLAGAARAQAPAGAPNAPDLLNKYGTNRPSWAVAGVDYHVGAPDGVALKDPTTSALPAGCSYASNTVTCSGSNVQLSGYNFAAHGTQLAVNGSGTISSNTFAMTSCNDPLVSLNVAQSLTFSANTVTGNAGQCSSLPSGAMINSKLGDAAKLTAQYNAFKNIPQDGIDVQGSNGTPANLTLTNNFVDGEGWVAHPDFVQTNGGKLSSVDISGNTYYSANNTVAGTQPLHVEAQLGSNINSTTVNNNVILTPGTCNSGSAWPNGCVANFDIACKNDPGWSDANTNFSASGNYIDSSGALAPTSNNYGCRGASFSNNVNMATGQSTGVGSPVSQSTGGSTVASAPHPSAPTGSIAPDQGTGTVQAATAPSTQPAGGPQTITPGRGTLTDAAGNVWTITANGSIREGDQWVPGGGGTSALAIINGTVYGEDAHGRGWFVLSGNDQYWTSTPAPAGIAGATGQTAAPQITTGNTATSIPTTGGTPTTQSQTPSSQTVAIPPSSCGSLTGGQFGILPLSQNGTGQIVDSAGNVFVPRGINIMEGQDPPVGTLKSLFPGINFVRYAIYDYTSPQQLAPYVNSLTSAGIVVELEDHNNNASNAGGSQGTIFSGQTLTSESSWYASTASYFKTNPYVWFGTNNEPSVKNASGQTDPGALSQWQRSTYDAIRGAGNQSIIFLETSCYSSGNHPVCNQGYDPSVYAGMSNVAWDSHVYGWLTNYNTDQATNDQFVANNVAALSSVKSAGGVAMPVIVGEYGNSTTGVGIDPNGTQVVNAVNKSVLNKTAAGASAWAWGSGNPGDGLTNGGSGLSGYGQQVASYLNQSAPGVSVCQGSAKQVAQGETQAGTTSVALTQDAPTTSGQTDTGSPAPTITITDPTADPTYLQAASGAATSAAQAMNAAIAAGQARMQGN